MEKSIICVVGSGNWATAIAKVVGENVLKLESVENLVNMFVYEEMHDEQKLSALINTLHVNAKYAPKIKLPENVVAVTDLVEAARHADIIIFVTPHKQLPDFCKTLLGNIKPTALAVTMTDAFVPDAEGGIQLPSHTVMRYLKIPCAVLIGANLATVLATDDYCEATLGCRDFKNSSLFRKLFNSETFRVHVIDDADCVEVCGFLKHVLSFGAGLLDGFDCNANIKSACIRFGFLEMIRFVDVFYPGCKLSTFFESCGLADLITVCFASRNRRLAEVLVKSKLSLEELELKVLGGTKLTTPMIASAIAHMLRQKGLERNFPLFTTIHEICQNTVKPEVIIDCIRNIPDIIYHPTNTFGL